MNNNFQDITTTHLELGLYEVAKLMKNNLKDLPQAFNFIASHIDFDSPNGLAERFLNNFSNNDFDKVLIFCGYEIELLDVLAPKFENIIVIPNDIDVDFNRIRENYIHHPNFKVLRPTVASDIVSPDTIILVPVFPLEDGSFLAYNYPCKLLSKDAKYSSFCVVAIEICKPLPIQYGYDFSGLTSVLSPINEENITHISSYKN